MVVKTSKKGYGWLAKGHGDQKTLNLPTYRATLISDVRCSDSRSFLVVGGCEAHSRRHLVC